MLAVVFVVPARNEAKHIKLCLDSINGQLQTSQEPLSISIVVVDNQSTDQTAEIAQQCGARTTEVQPGNAGRARNKGVSESESDFIAFIDADCVLPQDWLTHCLENLLAPGVVAVGAPQASAQQDATWVERTWVDCITKSSSHTWEAATWLPAFNLLLRRSDFIAAGQFDESLQTCEDSDLSFRLSKTGQLRTVQHPRVLHLGESQTLLEFFQREKWRSHGNFSSAMKRKSVMAEFPSLFLPLGFLFAIAVACISSAASPSLNRGQQFAVIACTCLIMLTPVMIALLKGGMSNLIPRSILIFTYLIARGLGPLMPTKRVARTPMRAPPQD